MTDSELFMRMVKKYKLKVEVFNEDYNIMSAYLYIRNPLAKEGDNVDDATFEVLRWQHNKYKGQLTCNISVPTCVSYVTPDKIFGYTHHLEEVTESEKISEKDIERIKAAIEHVMDNVERRAVSLGGCGIKQILDNGSEYINESITKWSCSKSCKGDNYIVYMPVEQLGPAPICPYCGNPMHQVISKYIKAVGGGICANTVEK